MPRTKRIAHIVTKMNSSKCRRFLTKNYDMNRFDLIRFHFTFIGVSAAINAYPKSGIVISMKVNISIVVGFFPTEFFVFFFAL